MKNPENREKLVDKLLHLSPRLFVSLLLVWTLAACDSGPTSSPTSSSDSGSTDNIWTPNGIQDANNAPPIVPIEGGNASFYQEN